MRGQTCSGGWRLAALLLGASWVVTLAVACGGGDNDVIDISGSGSVDGSGAHPESGVAVRASTDTATAPMHANGAAALPMALAQPCADEPRQVALRAAVLSHRLAPAAQGRELSDEALQMNPGRQSANAGAPLSADAAQSQ